MRANPAEHLWTLQQAARYCQVHEGTVRRWCFDGVDDSEGDRLLLPFTRFGRKILIDPAKLADFNEACKQLYLRRSKRKNLGLKPSEGHRTASEALDAAGI